jgi:hypothetical protein
MQHDESENEQQRNGMANAAQFSTLHRNGKVGAVRLV